MVPAAARRHPAWKDADRTVEPDDYAHLIVACLLHDIGYVRGILKGDEKNSFVVDESGRRVTLSRGGSDAALVPYHVERSIMFVKNRLGCSPFIDADRVARAIEFTQFPGDRAPSDEPEGREGRLVQGADLMGQLGDPLYLKKANALFYEFEEIGLNRQLGYASPADLVERFPDFYWSSVSPQGREDPVALLPVGTWTLLGCLRRGADPDAPVFRSRKGGGTLDKSAVHCVVMAAAERAGLSAEVSAYGSAMPTPATASIGVRRSPRAAEARARLGRHHGPRPARPPHRQLRPVPRV